MKCSCLPEISENNPDAKIEDGNSPDGVEVGESRFRIRPFLAEYPNCKGWQDTNIDDGTVRAATRMKKQIFVPPELDNDSFFLLMIIIRQKYISYIFYLKFTFLDLNTSRFDTLVL